MIMVPAHGPARPDTARRSHHHQPAPSDDPTASSQIGPRHSPAGPGWSRAKGRAAAGPSLVAGPVGRRGPGCWVTWRCDRALCDRRVLGGTAVPRVRGFVFVPRCAAWQHAAGASISVHVYQHRRQLGSGLPDSAGEMRKAQLCR
jgi:hypothetical protein